MKKLISVLLAAVMLLSSVTVVMADGAANTYELTGNLTFLKEGVFPGEQAHFNCYVTNTTGAGILKVQQSESAIAPNIAYASFPIVDVQSFKNALGYGNIEDYALEFDITKKCGVNSIQNIEIGLGVYNSSHKELTSSASHLKDDPAVIRTTPIGLSHKNMTKDVAIKMSIPVKDIINGQEELFEYENRVNPEFTADGINTLVVKAECLATTVNKATYLYLENVKLVKKTADITFDEENKKVNFSVCDYSANPALAGTQAIVAYYNDIDGDGVYTLVGCDVSPMTVSGNTATHVVDLAQTSLGGSDKIKAFLFNSMGELTPLTKAAVIR